jgi:hypothetical protein
LTTVLLEVSAGSSKQTGRAVVMPNSLVVDKPVFNESLAGDYGLCTLRVPVKASGWQEAERRLLDAAHAECSGFVDAARREIEDEGWKMGLGPDSFEPTTSLEQVKPDQVELVLRSPAPARRQGQVEQAIVRRFLSSQGQTRDEEPPTAA